MDGTILLADDDRTIRTVLTQALSRAGCKVHATSSLTTLMRWVSEGRGDTVITDVAMPDGNGIEMIPKITADRPDLPVIVISAQNTVMTAIQAKEVNAFDYLPKPFDLPQLMSRVKDALAATSDRRPVAEARSAEPDQLPLVGKSGVMQSLYRAIAGALRVPTNVLIEGESGTGKSLVAKTLHELSDRRAAPLVFVSPVDLPDADAMLQRLAQAKLGSLVIEELADFSADQQSLLLQMMHRLGSDGPRILVTSQSNLENSAVQGDLRNDLYYRLSGLRLRMPALRDRIEDIPLLAAHFLGRFDDAKHVSDEVCAQLSGQHWAGNVRQLRHVIEQAALTARGTAIRPEDIAPLVSETSDAVAPIQGRAHNRLSASVESHLSRYFELHGNDLPPAGLYARILNEIELPLLEIALKATHGNQAKCADLLGINRNTLRKKLTGLQIEVPRGRKMM